jgi:molybdate transport system substrate-binding protein
MVLFPQVVPVAAAEIRMIASPSLSAVMENIGPAFERATGHKLVISYGLIAPMRRHIETGGPFDLAIVPAALMDTVDKQGKFAPDSITEIARISLGVAARVGASKLDIGSVEAFKRAMLNARSVAYIPDEPTGAHLTKVFERLGIAAEMKNKTKPQQSLPQVMQAVVSGEAELGFAVVSNIVSERGVELVGRVPSELQYQVVLKAGIASAAAQGDAASVFIKYLSTPEAAAIFKAKGLDHTSQ